MNHTFRLHTIGRTETDVTSTDDVRLFSGFDQTVTDNVELVLVGFREPFDTFDIDPWRIQ